MGCGIFTRMARKLIFHNKIQQRGINFIRSRTSGGRNRSTNKIIIISVGKVTQLGIFLRHIDQASNLAHKQTKSKQKDERIKRQIFLCFSENILEVGACLGVVPGTRHEGRGLPRCLERSWDSG